MGLISTDVLTRQTAVVFSAVVVVATILATYIYQKSKNPKIPTEWTPVGKVARLCIYPLKSGRKLEVEAAECTKRGLKELDKPDSSFRLSDRAFVVYHGKNYEHRTARQYPKMVLVEVRACDADRVLFNAPNMQPFVLKVPSKRNDNIVTIRHLKREDLETIDCGQEAAIWISNYILGEDSGLRIGYSDGSFNRKQLAAAYKNIIKYYGLNLRNESAGINSDMCAMHLINNVSVIDCIKKIGNNEVTADYFRPTLLVDDPDLKPFEEDNWEWLKIGGVIMRNVYPCFRCIIPTIDPETGVRRNDREPVKTLETYRVRKGPQKTPIMGILLEVFTTGNISVGETVYVSKSL